MERKSLEDLAKSLVEGTLAYAVAELAALPRAAVVVEDRYSKVFSLDRVQPGWVAELLGRVQVRWPTVPIMFCETRALAQEWTFRFLGAPRAELAAGRRSTSTAMRPSAAGRTGGRRFGGDARRRDRDGRRAGGARRGDPAR